MQANAAALTFAAQFKSLQVHGFTGSPVCLKTGALVNL